MLNLNQKCVFIVRMMLNHCKAEVRVNDVPVFRDLNGDNIHLQVAVNEYMLAGENRLSLHLEPPGPPPDPASDEFSAGATGPDGEPLPIPLPEKTEIRAALMVRSKGDSEDNYVEIAAIDYQEALARSGGQGIENSPPQTQVPPSAGVVELSEVAIRRDPATGRVDMARTAKMNLPFPRWLWLRAEPLSETPALRRAVEGQLKRYWEALQMKNLQLALQLMPYKLKEYQEAFYMSQREAAEHTALAELLSDDELVLKPLKLDDAIMQINGFQRLVRLVDPELFESPLIFTNESKGVAFFHDAVFCVASNKLILIR